MKIGIELRPIQLGLSGGIAQFLKGILEALFSLENKHEYILFCTIFNRKLFEFIPAHVTCITLPITSFYQEVDRIVKDKDIKVLLRSFPVEDNLFFPLHQQIFLVPDLQQEFFPEFFTSEVLRSRRIAFNKALSKAGAICTLSQHAKKTLLEHPWTLCEDIFITSPTLQPELESTKTFSKVENFIAPKTDYFLFPANLWPHKNHRRTLQAFAQFLDRAHLNVELILTGHPAGWKSLKAEFPDLPVQHLGFVEPQVLSLLMSQAKALVFFSLFEGFGMPLLEAFNTGTPVICSNTTSLAEIGGDAVLSCDPTNIETMSQLMEIVLFNNTLRSELVQKGKIRLQRYSWKQAAQNLLVGCQRVIEKTSTNNSTTLLSQSEQPLVSIVTPSYNQGRYIRRTIESVLNQTYKNIEYIIIDGGSTDKTKEILSSYEDRFFWISEPDRGQTHAINKGLALSKGKIQAYLNSDDVLLSDAVEKVVNYFASHPECDMVYGNAFYINAEDKVTGKYNTAEFSFQRLMQDCCVCQPATFWRTRIAKLVGPFDEELNYVMDYEYWLRIDRLGGCIQFTPDVFAYSRLHDKTKTLTARNKIYQEIFKVCRNHGGYVHFNYYLGLWHHNFFEKNPENFTWKIVKNISFQTAARLNYILDNNLNLVTNFLLALLRKMKCLLQLIPLKNILRPPKYKRVRGFWPDNWLEPKTKIRLTQNMCARVWKLEGTVPIDTKLLIKIDQKIQYHYSLKRGEYAAVSFTTEKTINSRSILLEFSNHIIDAAKRKLSFHIHATNLFSEQDL